MVGLPHSATYGEFRAKPRAGSLLINLIDRDSSGSQAATLFSLLATKGTTLCAGYENL